MPIVVTTISSRAVKWSTRKPTATVKLRAGIQCKSVTATARSPPVPRTFATTSIAASHDSTTAPTGTQNASSPRRRPTTAVTRNPASGSAMMRTTRSCTRLTQLASSAHGVVLVDERRLAVAEDGDDDREADGRLGGGDGHDHQRDHRAVTLQIGDERAERHDAEIHRIEHQLDGHQHRDRVPAGEEPERPDGEQRAGERQVRVELLGDAHQPVASFSRLARNTPPITAARSSTLTASKASTYRSNSRWARSFVAIRTAAEAAPQFVPATATATSTATMIAAMAAGAACVWNVSRFEPTFSWVSMIANRIRTLIAPMYTITWAAATSTP